MKTWMPTKFHSNSTSLLMVYSSFCFTTFSMKSIYHTIGSFGTIAVRLIKPISKAFIKIYYFPKFHCHILGPSKVRRCSTFN